jgi:hypothetical protein
MRCFEYMNTLNTWQERGNLGQELEKKLRQIDPINQYMLEKFVMETTDISPGSPKSKKPASECVYHIRAFDKEEVRDMQIYGVLNTPFRLLLIRDNGIVFGRDLDGYRMLYSNFTDINELAHAIVARIRELCKITAVF